MAHPYKPDHDGLTHELHYGDEADPLIMLGDSAPNPRASRADRPILLLIAMVAFALLCLTVTLAISIPRVFS